MSDPSLPARQRLDATPAAIAPLLPALGRVMVVLSSGGATHERIGAIAETGIAAGRLHLHGDAHAAALDLAAIQSLVLDRSSRMRDKVYPRIEFRDGTDALQLSVIGMEGPEPFDAALAGFAGAALAAEERPARPEEAAAEDDPGAAALRALHAAGAAAEIRLATRFATQSWTGAVPEPRLAMGFANIILPDFHLHLRLGSVARFEPGPAGWAACDEAGVPTGLLLRPAGPEGEAVLAALA